MAAPEAPWGILRKPVSTDFDAQLRPQTAIASSNAPTPMIAITRFML
jgi:hypothetical protein